MTTTFTPAQQAVLDALKALDPIEAFELRGAITSILSDAEYPRLSARADESGDVVFVLPDGLVVDPSRIIEIDAAERWTRADYDVDLGEQRLYFSYGSADFENFVYTVDGTMPVRLPDGWDTSCL